MGDAGEPSDASSNVLDAASDASNATQDASDASDASFPIFFPTPSRQTNAYLVASSMAGPTQTAVQIAKYLCVNGGFGRLANQILQLPSASRTKLWLVA